MSLTKLRGSLFSTDHTKVDDKIIKNEENIKSLEKIGIYCV